MDRLPAGSRAAPIIVHADLDAFFASVEQRDEPDLLGRPVVVGGSAESRGVVAAASYEARAFGIHSAMSMAAALGRCPQLVRVAPRFDVYRAASEQVMALFRGLTELVEPVSLDEAFLDLSRVAPSWEVAIDRVHRLRQAVQREAGLTLSAGIGPSKSVAKIASDLGKPNGFVAVRAGRQRAFLESLPVGKLWGVGPRTEQRLLDVGIRTAGDLAAASPALLETLLGSFAEDLRRMAAGEDDRAVTPDHARKSVGRERTFAEDVGDRGALVETLRGQAADVAARLERQGLQGRTLTLKLRSADFSTHTRRTTQPSPLCDAGEIAAQAIRLLDDALVEGGVYRLLGISLSGFASDLQLPLRLPASAA